MCSLDVLVLVVLAPSNLGRLPLHGGLRRIQVLVGVLALLTLVTVVVLPLLPELLPLLRLRDGLLLVRAVHVRPNTAGLGVVQEGAHHLRRPCRGCRRRSGGGGGRRCASVGRLVSVLSLLATSLVPLVPLVVLCCMIAPVVTMMTAVMTVLHPGSVLPAAMLVLPFLLGHQEGGGDVVLAALRYGL